MIKAQEENIEHHKILKRLHLKINYFSIATSLIDQEQKQS